MEREKVEQRGVVAVEVERRRLAELLQSDVIAPLALLLAQARAYEQSLAAAPPARQAVSVLASLASQVLQQARDLEADLQPTILESLGIEPALEALAGRMVRARGLQVKLHLERLPQRLPAAVELALFRAVQTALRRAAHFAHASQVTVRMTGREDRVELAVFDNGHVRESTPELVASCQWIEQLGGHVTVGTGPLGGLQWAASFSLHPSATLTPREEKVLRLLSEGLSNKEIARALSISPRTVNFHLDNVYSKMGVHSRTEAVIHALRRGLIAQKPG